MEYIYYFYNFGNHDIADKILEAIERKDFDGFMTYFNSPDNGMEYDLPDEIVVYSENDAEDAGYLDVTDKNNFLKIWVVCGYYDAATPFYSAEWTYNHVFLNDESKDNLQFTYYPSGHMFYVDKEAFDSFRSDAENWYGGTR